MTGILGVLKAGGFYLPLSHHLPPDRAAEVISRSGADIMMLSEDASPVPASLLRGIPITEILRQEFATVSDREIAPSEYCYVMFTSGSTGSPKGVLQRQATILHNAEQQADSLGLTCEDRFSQLHSDATMGAVRATFNALLNGGTLYPFDVSAGNILAFLKWVQERQITILHSSASFFRLFAAAAEPRCFESVRVMILGGEAVIDRDFALFQKRFPAKALFCTGLGSTETTTIRMMLLTQGSRPVCYKGRLPLGYPVTGVAVELAPDLAGQEMPGNPSEIVVCSPFLFAGYWNEEVFHGERRYSMGDMAVRLPNGVLYHAGRKDCQIKVRGNRIDMLEIENIVRHIDGVKEAVMLPYQNDGGAVSLHVFAVWDGVHSLSEAKVRYFLRKKLAKNHQPSAVHIVKDVPRQQGGKIDIASLWGYCRNLSDGGSVFEHIRRGLSGDAARLFDCFDKTSFPFLKIWARKCGDNADFLNARMSKMDIDSLSMIEICCNIEEDFGYPIELETLRKINIVKRILKEVA